MTDLDRLKKAFLISRQVIRAKGEFALAQQLISLYGARLKLTAAMVRDAVLKWMQNGTIVRTSSRGLYLYKPA